MNRRIRFVSFLLSLLLLINTASCQKNSNEKDCNNESNKNAIEETRPQPSQALKERIVDKAGLLPNSIKINIEKAFFQNYGYDIHWSDENLFFGTRFYGSYNNLIILYTNSNSPTSSHNIEIENCCFSIEKNRTLLTYIDGSFVALEEAYRDNLLSKHDITKILEIHKTFEELIVTRSNELILPPLSPELKEEIELEWIEKFKNFPGWSTDEGNDLSYYGLRYYGIYNGAVVLYKKSMLTVAHSIRIAESVFSDGNMFKIYVYKNGVLLTIDEAYENQYLTKDNILFISEYHNKYKKQLNNLYEEN